MNATGGRIRYVHKAGCDLKLGTTTCIGTPCGGEVAVDDGLARIFTDSQGLTLGEILARHRPIATPPDLVRAALVCLVGAGLIEREIAEEEEKLPAQTKLESPLSTGPSVSVVIVAYRGQGWLAGLLPSLLEQSYPLFETVVVDNGSNDQTAMWLAEDHPIVRTIVLDRAVSFAAAVNRAVEATRGDLVLLLNQDVTLTPTAVAELVAAIRREPLAAAAASKLHLMRFPGFLNGLGNRVEDHGWGTDNGFGLLDLGQFDSMRVVPSACFAAALICRRAWDEIGQLDERFLMYYEDADWCYRARSRGFTIAAAPRAVVYHAFGGNEGSSVSGELTPEKRARVVHSRLRFAVKLVGRSRLLVFLRNYLREDAREVWRAIRKGDRRTLFAYLRGYGCFARDSRDLAAIRWRRQARTIHESEALFAPDPKLPPAIAWSQCPTLTLDLVSRVYLPLIVEGRTKAMPEFENIDERPRVLVVSNDIVRKKMAGPGMRYLEMAQALAPDLDVVLAVPDETDIDSASVPLVRYWEDRPESLQVLVDNADIAIVTGYMAERFPFLADTRTRLVGDLYDPFILENLYYYKDQSLPVREVHNQHAVAAMNRLLSICDFFICGNSRQRDLWLGALAAQGRVTPTLFEQDPSLRNLIDVVGMGLPERPPRRQPTVCGRHPAVPEDARLVLWGGGIWNWLDPLTLLEAWPNVVSVHPRARLVFLGTRHPNPIVPAHEMAQRAESLASLIGEKDRTVLFIDWLAYAEREGLLCEAAVGIALHPIHVETRYSLRTRVLDYIWARLPIVVTDGDTSSEWVREHGIGRVVPPSDRKAVAAALIEILARSKETWAPAFDALHQQFAWPRVVGPLREWCLAGKATAARGNASTPDQRDARPNRKRRRLAEKTLQTIRDEGLVSLIRKTSNYLRGRRSPD